MKRLREIVRLWFDPALCKRCAWPLADYHGTGYLICEKCGDIV